MKIINQFFNENGLSGTFKIFCISYQRTGTTSTGKFFIDHGFKVATWNTSRENNWTENWFKGDYETIFKSKDFLNSQVFEDDPWWFLEFYKVLYHRFPSARFILVERDADKWFNSMISHSSGKTLGNTHLHSIIYNRADEFYELQNSLSKRYTSELDKLLPLEEEHRSHYTKIYQSRNREVKGFFEVHNPDRLFIGQLEDEFLWHKMGKFFNIRVDQDYVVHANKSNNQ